MNRATVIAAASLVASACLAIGSAIVTDTTQPLARLTTVQAWQGASVVLQVQVRENGQPYTNAADVTLRWADSLTTAPATNGLAVLRPPAFTNAFSSAYYIACVAGSVTNPLGSGTLTVNSNAFFGGN